MSQTQRELAPEAVDPLRRIYRAAAQLSPKRGPFVRRLEVPDAPIGRFDAGRLALYGVHAGDHASPTGYASSIVHATAYWLTASALSGPGDIGRIDIQRTALEGDRNNTLTEVTLSSPPYTQADGRYGLRVGVQTKDGRPYDGWLGVVSTHTQHPADPAIITPFDKTRFFVAPESDTAHPAWDDARRGGAALMAAALPLLVDIGSLVEQAARKEIPDVVTSRLPIPG